MYLPGNRYAVNISENARTSTGLLKTMKRVLGDRLWPEEGFTGGMRSSRDKPVPDSWMMLALQRRLPTGRLGPVEHFYDTGDSPEGLVYRLGAGHSRYIRDEVERYRRGRPASDPDGPRRSMAHYWWKLNNTWPQVYSCVIDYFLEPNMAYYAMRRAHDPVLISFDIEDSIHVWLVNDTGTLVAGSLNFMLYDILGDKTLEKLEWEVEVGAGQSEVIADLDCLRAFNRNHVLYASLAGKDGAEITRTSDFTDVERNLAFPEAQLSLAWQDGALEIRTDRFARCVELKGDADGDEFGWYFEDNFFDLLPHEVKRLRLLGSHRRGKITAKPWFSPHIAEVEISRD
jgi:hypothetical protein